MIRFISDRNLYVLRDSANGRALNVSFSVEGLHWTSNQSGRLLYFKKAKLEREYNDAYEPIGVKIVGDKTPSTSYYVEKFVPTDKSTIKDQLAEYTAVDKGYRLLCQVHNSLYSPE